MNADIMSLNIQEYDLSSLGERFNFSYGKDYPHQIGVGSEEKRSFFESGLNEISHQIADEILRKEMISVKNNNHSFSVRADFVVVPMQEFYDMLNIIQKVTGTTRFNYS